MPEHAAVVRKIASDSSLTTESLFERWLWCRENPRCRLQLFFAVRRLFLFSCAFFGQKASLAGLKAVNSSLRRSEWVKADSKFVRMSTVRLILKALAHGIGTRTRDRFAYRLAPLSRLGVTISSLFGIFCELTL